MFFSEKFIYASEDCSSYENFVPAPYFRKTFFFHSPPDDCSLTITGLGFYRVWVNGTELTKGILAPYISNPDDIVYFDRYEIASYLIPGKNVLGVQLGNGMQNAPGGQIWDFDTARFRGAPRFSFAIEYGDTVLEADDTVKTAPSGLYFDDLRCGVRFDARRDIPGWNTPGFNDAAWAQAKRCEPPRGEFRLCEAQPVRPTGKELKPVSVTFATAAEFIPSSKVKIPAAPAEADTDGLSGYLYDFGENNAGIPRLNIHGKPGQRVILQFAELLTDGKVCYANIDFYPAGFAQRDVYVCGGEDEVFEPPFTYHGFRYCLVSGITPEQATEELLTFVVCSSDFPSAGAFCCSDETANTLYRMCENSDRANFYYFPTDCPHREKNGWTGDAALSARHMLMTMRCGESFREWMRNICAAQKTDGRLPGIIPTAGWGYGLGPSWDAVITSVPYETYIFTGDKTILKETAPSILRYLSFAASRREEDGLVEYGLGDWCPVKGQLKATKRFTNSVSLYGIAKQAAFIFRVLSMQAEAAFADTIGKELFTAVRRGFIDSASCVADTGCQTSQAMALYYGLFLPEETQKARQNLINAIHANSDFIDFGILGARVIFHILSDAGEQALAYQMITRPEYPSYGYLIGRGMTSLTEDFDMLEPGNKANSANHHMYGDIKGWFISDIAGLQYTRDISGRASLTVRPGLIKTLSFAEGSFQAPEGDITVGWERKNGAVRLSVAAPETVAVSLALPVFCKYTGTVPSAGSFEIMITE